MHGTIRRDRKVAITDGDRIATERSLGGKSAVDDGEWFSRAARTLFPSKAGTALHLTTNLGDERLCQRYASGEVRPPAYFLRALLRSTEGKIWLAAVMDGCNAEWWHDLQREQKIGASAIAAMKP